MRNTRLRITYFMLLAWVGFGIFGILMQVNLAELAAYFGASAAFVGPYIWGETKRSSNASSDFSSSK